MLAIRGLTVVRPDGAPLFRNLDLDVQAGEVVALLGGSGAGKSTLARVLFEPEPLRDQGFETNADAIRASVPLGLVPQRGALFDHLDVAGNIRLALRYADQAEGGDDVVEWLRRVDLDESLAAPGTPVATLSGGQAQRLAVARTLAGGRKLLFLDEPSVGLDPARVRILARQIRCQAEEAATSFIVVTHDVALAAGVADRLLFLDAVNQRVIRLFDGEWPGPFDSPRAKDADRALWQSRVEAAMVTLLGESGEAAAKRGRTRPAVGRGRAWLEGLSEPFRVATAALAEGWRHLGRRPADYLSILGRALFQALVRPLPFYAIVSTLLGYTVLYVITHVVRDLSAHAAVQFIGSSHIVALVPPITAFLFVAASGNAVNAWLGGMSLTKQIAALEALGISRRTYLWSPTWMGLGLACLAVSAVFALGMTVGGWLYCIGDGVQDGWKLLTADFSDPRPERVPYLVRAGWLIFLYAWGIASDSVASGTLDKTESEHVTRAMTGSVVRCTLWVVCLELASTVILFAVQG